MKLLWLLTLLIASTFCERFYHRRPISKCRQNAGKLRRDSEGKIIGFWKSRETTLNSGRSHGPGRLAQRRHSSPNKLTGFSKFVDSHFTSDFIPFRDSNINKSTHPLGFNVSSGFDYNKLRLPKSPNHSLMHPKTDSGKPRTRSSNGQSDSKFTKSSFIDLNPPLKDTSILPEETWKHFSNHIFPSFQPIESQVNKMLSQTQFPKPLSAALKNLYDYRAFEGGKIDKSLNLSSKASPNLTNLNVFNDNKPHRSSMNQNEFNNTFIELLSLMNGEKINNVSSLGDELRTHGDNVSESNLPHQKVDSPNAVLSDGGASKRLADLLMTLGNRVPSNSLNVPSMLHWLDTNAGQYDNSSVMGNKMLTDNVEIGQTLSNSKSFASNQSACDSPSNFDSIMKPLTPSSSADSVMKPLISSSSDGNVKMTISLNMATAHSNQMRDNKSRDYPSSSLVKSINKSPSPVQPGIVIKEPVLRSWLNTQTSRDGLKNLRKIVEEIDRESKYNKTLTSNPSRLPAIFTAPSLSKHAVLPLLPRNLSVINSFTNNSFARGMIQNKINNRMYENYPDKNSGSFIPANRSFLLNDALKNGNNFQSVVLPLLKSTANLAMTKYTSGLRNVACKHDGVHSNETVESTGMLQDISKLSLNRNIIHDEDVGSVASKNVSSNFYAKSSGRSMDMEHIVLSTEKLCLTEFASFMNSPKGNVTGESFLEDVDDKNKSVRISTGTSESSVSLERNISSPENVNLNESISQIKEPNKNLSSKSTFSNEVFNYQIRANASRKVLNLKQDISSTDKINLTGAISQMKQRNQDSSTKSTLRVTANSSGKNVQISEQPLIMKQNITSTEKMSLNGIISKMKLPNQNLSPKPSFRGTTSDSGKRFNSQIYSTITEKSLMLKQNISSTEKKVPLKENVGQLKRVTLDLIFTATGRNAAVTIEKNIIPAVEELSRKSSDSDRSFRTSSRDYRLGFTTFPMILRTESESKIGLNTPAGDSATNMFMQSSTTNWKLVSSIPFKANNIVQHSSVGIDSVSSTTNSHILSSSNLLSAAVSPSRNIKFNISDLEIPGFESINENPISDKFVTSIPLAARLSTSFKNGYDPTNFAEFEIPNKSSNLEQKSNYLSSPADNIVSSGINTAGELLKLDKQSLSRNEDKERAIDCSNYCCNYNFSEATSRYDYQSVDCGYDTVGVSFLEASKAQSVDTTEACSQSWLTEENVRSPLSVVSPSVNMNNSTYLESDGRSDNPKICIVETAEEPVLNKTRKLCCSPDNGVVEKSSRNHSQRAFVKDSYSTELKTNYFVIPPIILRVVSNSNYSSFKNQLNQTRQPSYLCNFGFVDGSRQQFSKENSVSEASSDKNWTNRGRGFKSDGIASYGPGIYNVSYDYTSQQSSPSSKQSKKNNFDVRPDEEDMFHSFGEKEFKNDDRLLFKNSTGNSKDPVLVVSLEPLESNQQQDRDNVKESSRSKINPIQIVVVRKPSRLYGRSHPCCFRDPAEEQQCTRKPELREVTLHPVYPMYPVFPIEPILGTDNPCPTFNKSIFA